MATVHGSLWINQYLNSGVGYFLSQPKPRLGMAAYGALCMIVLLSLRPVRSRYYQLFFITQYVYGLWNPLASGCISANP
jgi:ferric-chelate reductase